MSVRREARRAQLATAAPVLAGVDVPPELLDRDAAVWHDQRAYHRYMTDHGWPLPPAERMGMATAPANRRRTAAARWARDHHITRDWHQLRAWGLID